MPQLLLKWRRGSESNRRMGLLQSPALPLGYPAIKLKKSPILRRKKDIVQEEVRSFLQFL